MKVIIEYPFQGLFKMSDVLLSPCVFFSESRIYFTYPVSHLLFILIIMFDFKK